MNDNALLSAFEQCTLPIKQWNHRAHVRVAYLYASHHDLESAIDKMRSGIKAFNRITNTPEAIDRGYHETMTQAFLRLVHSAILKSAACASSEDFCVRHPELLDKRALLAFYTRKRIMTWEAKKSFVEPDITPLSVDVLLESASARREA